MAEVLILQHQVGEGPGTILDEIKKSGHMPHLLRIDQGEKVPRSTGDWGGIVVMGGSMGVSDQGKLPHLKEEIGLLKLFLKEDRAILGICLGAQLLAAAVGREVKPGKQEIGWFV